MAITALGVAGLERMRQELEEHGAEQRADGERHDAGDPRPMQRERAAAASRREHAAGKRGGDDLHRMVKAGSRLGARQGPWLRGSERIAAGTPHYTHRE